MSRCTLRGGLRCRWTWARTHHNCSSEWLPRVGKPCRQTARAAGFQRAPHVAPPRSELTVWLVGSGAAANPVGEQ